MTELQPYTVIARRDGYELRHYPACTVVDVEVVGQSFGRAGSIGFGPLLRYISGGNKSGERFAMTAPVIQHRAHDVHVVTFVLPEGTAQPPAPADSRVFVREVPDETVAVRRYSGSTGEDAYQRNLAQLRVALVRDGISEVGPPRLARYDPPWRPPFLRRNEAQVPVDLGAVTY